MLLTVFVAAKFGYRQLRHTQIIPFQRIAKRLSAYTDIHMLSIVPPPELRIVQFKRIDTRKNQFVTKSINQSKKNFHAKAIHIQK